MNPIRAVLLDADQTLWHGKSRGNAWRDALASAGIGIPLDLVEEADRRVMQLLASEWEALSTTGRPNEQLATDALLERFNLEMLRALRVEVDADSFSMAARRSFEGSRQLFPDTVPVLKALRGAYRVAIVSNGAYQAEMSRLLGIGHYFDEIIGSLHVGVHKPRPEIFHLALSALDIEPHEAVMVGDTWEHDIVGAQAVGIRALHIVRDGGPSPGPDAITDLWGLLQFLKEDAPTPA